MEARLRLSLGVEGLRRAVRASFRRLGRDKVALRGFFRHAGLTLLTPYPNTPLLRRMEADGRLLHLD